MNDIPFPQPVCVNRRLYWRRSVLEKYKADCFGGVSKFDGPDVLVPARTVADEFGVTRRTIGRRFAESAALAQGEDGRAATFGKRRAAR